MRRCCTCGWRSRPGHRLIFHGRSLDAVAYGSKHFLHRADAENSRGGRDADDDSILDGRSDVDRAYEVGGLCTLHPWPVLLRVNTTTDVTGVDDDSLVAVGAEFRGLLTEPW